MFIQGLVFLGLVLLGGPVSAESMDPCQEAARTSVYSFVNLPKESAWGQGPSRKLVVPYLLSEGSYEIERMDQLEAYLREARTDQILKLLAYLVQHDGAVNVHRQLLAGREKEFKLDQILALLKDPTSRSFAIVHLDSHAIFGKHAQRVLSRPDGGVGLEREVLKVVVRPRVEAPGHVEILNSQAIKLEKVLGPQEARPGNQGEFQDLLAISTKTGKFSIAWIPAIVAEVKRVQSGAVGYHGNLNLSTIALKLSAERKVEQVQLLEALEVLPEDLTLTSYNPLGLTGPRSDLFALGVVLYELIAGKRPVDQLEPLVSKVMASATEVERFQFFEFVPLEKAQPSMTASFCKIVNRCLSDPSYTLDEFLGDVQGYIGG